MGRPVPLPEQGGAGLQRCSARRLCDWHVESAKAAQDAHAMVTSRKRNLRMLRSIDRIAVSLQTPAATMRSRRMPESPAARLSVKPVLQAKRCAGKLM